MERLGERLYVVDFFNEVEEDLRADRLRTLFRKYGPPALIAVIVVLVVGGAFVGWSYWRDAQAQRASTAYDRGVAAMQAGDKAKAESAFEEAAKAGGGYKALALMGRAGILAGDKPDEAVKLFDAAAKAAPDAIIGDAARLKAAFLLMDKEPYAKLEERLKPLTTDKSPYRVYALEALAFAKLQAGRAKEARDDFTILSADLRATDQIRERAHAAIQMIDSGVANQLPAIVKAAGALPPPPPAAAPNPFDSSAGSPAPQAGAVPQ